jgi:hypothetical protein
MQRRRASAFADAPKTKNRRAPSEARRFYHNLSQGIAALASQRRTTRNVGKLNLPDAIADFTLDDYPARRGAHDFRIFKAHAPGATHRFALAATITRRRRWRAAVEFAAPFIVSARRGRRRATVTRTRVKTEIDAIGHCGYGRDRDAPQTHHRRKQCSCQNQFHFSSP